MSKYCSTDCKIKMLDNVMATISREMRIKVNKSR